VVRSQMKTVIQVRNPSSRADCLAVVQLTAKNFAAEVRGAGQTPEQYIDIETDELHSNTDLWSQIGGLFSMQAAEHACSITFRSRCCQEPKQTI